MADFHPETFSPWYRPRDGGPPLSVVPGGLPAETLLRLQALGMLAFYLRPRPIVRFLRHGPMPWRELVLGGRHFLADLVASINWAPAARNDK